MRTNVNQMYLRYLLPYVTVEAALWLTLAMIDTRIQRAISKEISNAEFEPWQYRGGFLALWCHACQKADPFLITGRASRGAGQHNMEIETEFIDTIRETLSSWESKDTELCIERPQAYDVLPNGTCLTKSITKGEFYKWTRDGREERLLKIIPWLHIRCILLYYYLECHGDSTKVAQSEDMPLNVRMR